MILYLKKKNRVCTEISCGECPAIYIGQTDPKLSKRISEHRSTITSNNNNWNGSKSAVVLHCFNTGHDGTKITGRLLHSCHKSGIMNRSEEAETISAHQSAGPFLSNYLTNTFTNPFLRHFYHFSLQINS